MLPDDIYRRITQSVDLPEHPTQAQAGSAASDLMLAYVRLALEAGGTLAVAAAAFEVTLALYAETLVLEGREDLIGTSLTRTDDWGTDTPSDEELN